MAFWNEEYPGSAPHSLQRVPAFSHAPSSSEKDESSDTLPEKDPSSRLEPAARNSTVILKTILQPRPSFEKSCLLVTARFDQEWKQQTQPEPAVSPRSTLARQRLDPSFRVSVTDLDGREHKVRGSVDHVFPIKLKEFGVSSYTGVKGVHRHKTLNTALTVVPEVPKLQSSDSDVSASSQSDNQVFDFVFDVDLLTNCKSSSLSLPSQLPAPSLQKSNSRLPPPHPSPLSPLSTFLSLTVSISLSRQTIVVSRIKNDPPKAPNSHFPLPINNKSPSFNSLSPGSYVLSLHTPPSTSFSPCDVASPKLSLPVAVSTLPQPPIPNAATSSSIKIPLPVSWTLASLQASQLTVSLIPLNQDVASLTANLIASKSVPGMVHGSVTIPAFSPLASLSSSSPSILSAALRVPPNKTPSRRFENGNYKNGPLSAIRNVFVGAVWLAKAMLTVDSTTVSQSVYTVDAIRCGGLNRSLRLEHLLREKSLSPLSLNVTLPYKCCEVDVVNIHFPALKIEDNLLNPYHAKGRFSIPSSCEKCLLFSQINAKIMGFADANTTDVMDVFSPATGTLVSESFLNFRSSSEEAEEVEKADFLNVRQVIDVICPSNANKIMIEDHLQIGIAGALALSLISLLFAALMYLLCLKVSTSKVVGGELPDFDDEDEEDDEQRELNAMANQQKKQMHHQQVKQQLAFDSFDDQPYPTSHDNNQNKRGEEDEDAEYDDEDEMIVQERGSGASKKIFPATPSILMMNASSTPETHLPPLSNAQSNSKQQRGNGETTTDSKSGNSRNLLDASEGGGNEERPTPNSFL
eukprot:GDKK01068011.1.p1 GENE.GDKK01068011.1~~GDKK01068011.1.p1  ORF type:complete len:826 (+),score=262.44 GDKK01068011.1:70-2478(+)